MFNFILKHRRLIVVEIHLFLIIISNYLAFYLRFDWNIPGNELAIMFEALPWLIAIRSITFIPFRLYRGLWRYTSIWDLSNILLAVGSSSLLLFVWIRWVLGLTGYPISIYIIDSILLVFFLGGIRLTRRVYRELGWVKDGKKVLIFGAGDAGEMLVRDMNNNPYYSYEPVGFVDDDQQKKGLLIHRIEVLGTRKDLKEIFNACNPDEVLIAIPSASPKEIRTIVDSLELFNVPIKTLPNIKEILDGKVKISQIRDLSLEDLLSRDRVIVNDKNVSRYLEGKKILVTGAGGSIGSELCRQIASYKPDKLFLFEHCENGLFNIMNNLQDLAPALSCHPIIGDIIDQQRLTEIFDKYRPDLVFHAAAHKHVPLMELNPSEAIKNNILGTQNVATISDRFSVEAFILISTDKAVNPTSIMGATKRVAEEIVKVMNAQSNTDFTIVRFGNVLGSNGSVVPVFMEQIKKGGPVTVTHPEVKRFFMLIPEAVHLVLQAATIGKGGEIFVLDMGEQIKIVEMARNLIRLSGLIPDKDIKIIFTGLRHGEKLFEELFDVSERSEPTEHEKIFFARGNGIPEINRLNNVIMEIKKLSEVGDITGIINKLKELVTSYKPSGYLEAENGNSAYTEIS